ncbi:MAG TPA: FKBP-type peptidyl-prolyl cis-trans isomerase [Terriglobales bacterium]|nr:FKBP-type peptidyl-prolyl cis-trans isomerase [Terriglobales bacterium]
MRKITLLVSLLLCASLLVAQSSTAAPSSSTAAKSTTKSSKKKPTGAAAAKTTPSGVKYWDLKTGTGAVAENGKLVTVNYLGTLTSGKKFDSSYDRHEPFQFRLGQGDVIKGWDEGVAGMKVGGKRKLRIPPAAGYGAHGAGGGLIPPNATLIFTVELLKVQ